MFREQAHKIGGKSIIGNKDVENNILIMIREGAVNHIGRYYAEITLLYGDCMLIVNVNAAPPHYIKNFDKRMVMEKRRGVTRVPDNRYGKVLFRETVVVGKYLLYLGWGAGRELPFTVPFYHFVPAMGRFRVQFRILPVNPPVNFFFPGERQKTIE
jgi:hypothetical protein